MTRTDDAPSSADENNTVEAVVQTLDGQVRLGHCWWCCALRGSSVRSGASRIVPRRTSTLKQKQVEEARAASLTQEGPAITWRSPSARDASVRMLLGSWSRASHYRTDAAVLLDDASSRHLCDRQGAEVDDADALAVAEGIVADECRITREDVAAVFSEIYAEQTFGPTGKASSRKWKAQALSPEKAELAAGAVVGVEEADRVAVVCAVIERR